MKPAVKALLEKANSNNKDIQHDAILRLTLILEMNTFSKSEHQRVREYDDGFFPWNLLFITLNKKEQAEIAENLSQIFIASEKPIRSILWALGKTEGKTGLAPLLEIIQRCHEKFSDSDSYQALISFSDCLDYERCFDAETKSLFQKKDPIPFLKIQSQSSDSQVAGWAKSLLNDIFIEKFEKSEASE